MKAALQKPAHVGGCHRARVVLDQAGDAQGLLGDPIQPVLGKAQVAQGGGDADPAEQAGQLRESPGRRAGRPIARGDLGQFGADGGGVPGHDIGHQAGDAGAMRGMGQRADRILDRMGGRRARQRRRQARPASRPA